jgi:two-component system, sensor histidine kinase and response regulator
VILTYSQFLLDDAAPALAPEQVEFIHRIRSSSAFMLSLVNDLLDVAKIEAGKLSLDLAPVDLAALVERNVALNRALAEKRGVRLDLKLGEELPRPLVVALDAPKIEQVLNNLIGNAVKFSPPGAAVEVGLAHGGRALVTVRDAGPGISPEEREKLFRPFVTFAKPRTAGGDLEKGTGLGLAIVRKIVAGHGGDLWVESEEGKGATFYVALPTEAAGAVER